MGKPESMKGIQIDFHQNAPIHLPMIKISAAVISVFLTLSAAVRGQTPVSFGQALAGNVTLPNGTVMSAAFITGTQGTAGTNHGDTSNNSPALGGTFDGTVFDGTVNPFYATRLMANPNQSVDNGVSLNRRDFVGIRVHFSQATEISSFYFVDIDGTSQNDSQEWAASFAYDGPTLLVPTLAFPSSGSNLVTAATVNISSSWNTLVDNTLGTSVDNLPSTWALGEQLFTGANGNLDPDAANSQMKVSYNSAVTDVFVFFGVRNDRSAALVGAQNSGITGFTVTVPEPSGTLSTLAAMGAFFLGRTRRTR